MKMKHKIKYILISPFAGLLLTLISSKTFSSFGDRLEKFLYIFFGSLLIIYIIISLIFIIHKFYQEKKWKKQYYHSCVYEQINHDWQINEKGDFFLRTQFNLKNISNEYLEFLPVEKGLFFSKIHEYEHKIMANKGGKYRIIEFRSFFDDNIYPYLNFKKTYELGLSLRISPALKPNDEINFEEVINTIGTEKDAFKEKGTIAGIPANIPIKKVNFRFIAPPKYKFELLEPLFIMSFNGSNIKPLPDNIPFPKLNSSSTILTWELNNLIAFRRYSFKYRFIKE
jgi:hypothetical protein